MMRIVVSLVACMLVLSCGQAHADDPAIVLCETLIKSELLAPKSYERVSAYIDGSRVKITYDAVNRYNAPLRHHEECVFSKQSDGTYLLEDDTNVDAELDRMKEISQNIPSDPGQKDKLRTELAEIEARATFKLKRAIARQAMALASGPYPIAGATTGLR